MGTLCGRHDRIGSALHCALQKCRLQRLTGRWYVRLSCGYFLYDWCCNCAYSVWVTTLVLLQPILLTKFSLLQIMSVQMWKQHRFSLLRVCSYVAIPLDSLGILMSFLSPYRFRDRWVRAWVQSWVCSMVFLHSLDLGTEGHHVMLFPSNDNRPLAATSGKMAGMGVCCILCLCLLYGKVKYWLLSSPKDSNDNIGYLWLLSNVEQLAVSNWRDENHSLHPWYLTKRQSCTGSWTEMHFQASEFLGYCYFERFVSNATVPLLDMRQS